jgi:3-oxoacyl-[acyl-carrier protein] reductase
MELDLKGRIALVTGGSRGIGFGVAQGLAAEGCHLHLASRSAEGLAAARSALVGAYGVNVTVHAMDLAKPENALALAGACGAVDILVNNAGAIPQGSILDLDDATLRNAWSLKLFGYVNVTREIYRGMRERRSGVIVNVVGNAGERPKANYLGGGMANSALMAMSRAIGGESIEHNVRVVAVNPGAVETDRQIALWKARAQKEFNDESRWRELTTGFPRGRMATVDEVANMVVFLCSERSAYTTGTVITIDGGASVIR